MLPQNMADRGEPNQGKSYPQMMKSNKVVKGRWRSKIDVETCKNCIKSPSDTTIYTPALNKQGTSPVLDLIGRHHNQHNQGDVLTRPTANDNSTINNVSQFVEQIRRNQALSGTSPA